MTDEPIDYGNGYAVGRNDIVLAAMQDPLGRAFLVWIDTDRDILNFGHRWIELEKLDESEHGMLGRLVAMKQHGTSDAAYTRICDGELGPLIEKYLRITTH